eukprot:5995078-Prymnesium_polylepis.1
MGATSVVFNDISRVPSGEPTRPKTREWGPPIQGSSSCGLHRHPWRQYALPSTKTLVAPRAVPSGRDGTSCAPSSHRDAQ